MAEAMQIMLHLDLCLCYSGRLMMRLRAHGRLGIVPASQPRAQTVGRTTQYGPLSSIRAETETETFSLISKFIDSLIHSVILINNLYYILVLIIIYYCCLKSYRTVLDYLQPFECA